MNAEIDALVARASRAICTSLQSGAKRPCREVYGVGSWCSSCQLNALADELERLAASRPAPAPQDADWLRRQAAAEDNGIVSAGGLVTDLAAAPAPAVGDVPPHALPKMAESCAIALRAHAERLTLPPGVAERLRLSADVLNVLAATPPGEAERDTRVDQSVAYIAGAHVGRAYGRQETTGEAERLREALTWVRVGLDELRPRVSSHDEHLGTCNGDEDTPCDCGSFAPSERVEALLMQIDAALAPRAQEPVVPADPAYHVRRCFVGSDTAFLSEADVVARMKRAVAEEPPVNVNTCKDGHSYRRNAPPQAGDICTVCRVAVWQPGLPAHHGVIPSPGEPGR